MLKDILVAKKLNKPFYIGEVGFRCGTDNCIQASAEAEKERAKALRQEISDLFSAGASGFLVWQYSDRKSDHIDNDPYSFFEGDPICGVLKESSQKLSSVSSCPAIGRISAPYGYNIPEYPDVANEGCGNLPRCHNGMDIAAAEDSPIKSPLNGKVTAIDYDDFKGNYLEITDQTGLIATFEHLRRINTNLNATVLKGEIVGNVGRTGKVTGPVLHYKIRREGVLLNPLRTLGSSAILDAQTLIASDDIAQNDYQNRVPAGGIENWGQCIQ